MPKIPDPNEIEEESNKVDVKDTLIHLGVMIGATAATLAATHFAIKKLEKKDKGQQ